MFERILGGGVCALALFTAGVQVGMWHERTTYLRPVTLHAVKCEAGMCFADDNGREMQLRVRGNKAQPYYPTAVP